MRLKLTPITGLVAFTAATVFIFFSSVPAKAVMSSFEGGDFYYARNITKNTDFGDPTNATACDELQFRIRAHNPGPQTLTNVTVQAAFTTAASTQNVSLATLRSPDASPSNVSDTATTNLSTAEKLTYEANSTQLLDANQTVIRNYVDGADNTVTLNGITVNIGTLGVSLNETRFVQFKEKVNCPPPTPPPSPTPAFSCDAFDITSDANRTVKITKFSTTASNGAVFKNAVVDWGDTSADLTDTDIVGKTHQYGKDGTFTITATAHFTVNGEDKTASGPNCAKQVTFQPSQPPQVTPPSPTTPTTPAAPAVPTTVAAPSKLVNTGPSGVAGVFTFATITGALAHRWMLSRRLSRQ